jgi:uncharacterized delta-60 repeat protein
VKFGGDGDESANCVNGTSSGGMIVAGYTTSFGAGNRDFWVLKLDSQGSPLWQKTFGGPRDDYARSIQQTSDGGFIVAGVTKSFGAGDYDAWVLKLRSNGSKQWQKTYGGKRGDYAHAVRQTADGGYIIAGSTGSFGHGGMDFWLLKLNSAGGIQWEKAYGGPKDESAFAVDILPEGDFYVAGRSESFGSGMYDAMVLRVNKNGSIAAGCSAFAKNTNAVKNTSDAKVKTTTITTYPGYVFEYGSVLWPLVLTAALLNVPCH